jgi:hypothetical protein
MGGFGNICCRLMDDEVGVLAGGRTAFRFERVYIFGTPGVRSVCHSKKTLAFIHLHAAQIVIEIR